MAFVGSFSPAVLAQPDPSPVLGPFPAPATMLMVPQEDPWHIFVVSRGKQLQEGLVSPPPDCNNLEMQLAVCTSQQLCSRTLSLSVDFQALPHSPRCRCPLHLSFIPPPAQKTSHFPPPMDVRELTVPVPSILTPRSPPRGHPRGGQQTLLTFISLPPVGTAPRVPYPGGAPAWSAPICPRADLCCAALRSGGRRLTQSRAYYIL